MGASNNPNRLMGGLRVETRGASLLILPIELVGPGCAQAGYTRDDSKKGMKK